MAENPNRPLPGTTAGNPVEIHASTGPSLPQAPVTETSSASAPQVPEEGHAELPLDVPHSAFRTHRLAAEASRGQAHGQAPVRWRELFAVTLLVVLADVTIYRGEGFAGYAAWFIAAPLLLLLGAPRPRTSANQWIVGAMLLLLSADLVWLGSGLSVAAGFALLVAFAMTLAGLSPYVLDVLVYACESIKAGALGLVHYLRSADELTPAVPRAGGLKVLLPAIAVAGFGTLFVLANPDVATAVGRRLEWFFDSLWDAIQGIVPSWGEVIFWAAIAWFAVGLLRPVMRQSVLASLSKERRKSTEVTDAPLYAAFRNTLVAVIALFAVYLGFEFTTLWFREFPKGFYYAGYAHEGAAWLTVALALATVVLSAIFRGRILDDPRLPRLRKLAWIWSAENLLLALAVYHRLYIYIGFNGMTRMRTVGLFGISAVVVGFFLVVWKIVNQRDFVWLLQRQLWTLAVALYLLAVTPVDALVHAYNVRRILAGDLAPSVQISVHPIDSGGILVLPPLMHSEDQIIREGIRALLAERALTVEAALDGRRRQQNWTSFQFADQVLLEKLRAARSDWNEYADAARRQAALVRFHAYAYQWY